MKLKVLTTSRKIRELVQEHPTGMMDKIVPVGEFFSKAVIVDAKRRIDPDLKKIYLYRAMEKVDVSSLGLSRDFLRFFKNSDLVFDFWSELAKEGVSIEELAGADTYGEYDEHIGVLRELLEKYQDLLDKDDFYDEVAWEKWRINEAYFDSIDEVELELVGYLGRFERDVLAKVPVPVKIAFVVSRYNHPLIEKMFGPLEEGVYLYDFHNSRVISHDPLPKSGDVETAAFEERIWQVQYALASIQEFYDDGLKPEKMAIILPDESMGEYLRLFNNGNLNFAMGEPFERSQIYSILKAIYDYLVEKDPVAYEKIAHLLDEFGQSDLLEFIKKHASEKELVVLDEELHKIARLFGYISQDDPNRRLHFVLERLRKLSFDDIKGGKVTVMGVLESRGVEFDGVVLLDFNEEVVPSVGSGDMFLNSVVRKRVGLPTRKDREALQKHYYHQILQNAKKVRIAYVQNDEKSPSRFLYELGLNDGRMLKERYAQVLFSFREDPEPTDLDGISFDRPEKLYPNSMHILYQCPKRYYLRYVQELKNDIEESEFNFGVHFHNTIEKLLEPEPVFESAREYYEKLMERLLDGRAKKERYIIQSKWAERVEWFCGVDFGRLGGTYSVERFDESRQLEGYTLLAKFDRMDDEFVIDYKTGDPKEADEIQALFYQYIFGKTPLFYYLKSKKVVPKVVDDPEAKLRELVGSLEFVTRDAEDEKACRWCEYRFLCKQVP